jgi:hypothetical protein
MVSPIQGPVTSATPAVSSAPAPEAGKASKLPDATRRQFQRLKTEGAFNRTIQDKEAAVERVKKAASKLKGFDPKPTLDRLTSEIVFLKSLYQTKFGKEYSARTKTAAK